MKHFIVALFLLFTSYLFACDCDAKKPILEFYNAEFVFEGIVTSKAYTQDFQNYTITFYISKHYKKGAKPRALSFVLSSEEEYTDKSSSCDWSVNLNEKWLVYAHLGNDGILYFDGICSNSKKINYNRINSNEQKVLDNGNDFILGDYTYYKEGGFTYTTPITSMDSIMLQVKTKHDKDYFTIVHAYINKQGILQKVFGSKQYPLKYSKIFGLATGFVEEEYIPLNNFEEEAIGIVEKIKKWEIKYHKKTKVPVAQFRSIIFQYNKEKDTWSYEF